jgi:hypothetical protein
LLFEHDLFGKPLRTFPGHALAITLTSRRMNGVVGNLAHLFSAETARYYHHSFDAA